MADTYEATQEVRLAVVMYGGISLAIYMSGIAQEMLALVRATAPAPGSGKLPLVTAPSGTMGVYRELAKILDPAKRPDESLDGLDAAPIRTRFVVDILSGSSAGGLNAVFLGKALATGLDLKKLKSIWLDKGDIVKLVNDASATDVEPQVPPPSLLSGPRMYLDILEGLDDMDVQSREEEEPRAPLVEKLDLFITATDLDGLILPISLADGPVEEKRHTAHFHFRYDTSRYDRWDDFKQQDNPFLAFAGRCTSSFPVAFEPMTLDDAFDVFERKLPHRGKEYCDRQKGEWERFYPAYTAQPGLVFRDVEFADGGYLDNKPFSYAVDATFQRHADLPVDRRLIYVEPSPERLASPKKSGKVDAFDNTLAALTTLPRYETIRGDLERVIERNAQIERVMRALEKLLRDPDALPDVPVAGGDPRAWLSGRLGTETSASGAVSPSYRTYEKLKITAVTDDLARIVSRAFGVARGSGEAKAIRMLTWAWRTSKATSDGRGYEDRERQFLLDYDVSYRLRRIAHLRRSIDERYRQGKSAYPDEYRSELICIRQALRQPYEELRSLLERRWTAAAPPAGAANEGPSFMLDDLDMGAVRRAMEHVLGETDAERHCPESEMLDRAQGVFGDASYREPIANIAEAVQREFGATLKTRGDEVRHEISRSTSRDGTGPLGPGGRQAHEELTAVYEQFEARDSLMFPILFGSDVGEETAVKIHRFSPDDARRLNEYVPSGPKLRGTAFGAFGGFFDERWRRNDILWGRLDAAELLVRMMLPDARDERVRDKRTELINRAHEAIVWEELGRPAGQKTWKEHLRDELAKCPMDPDPTTLARAASRSAYVAGEMLQGIAQDRRTTGKPFATLAVAGRILIALVEAALPQTFANLVFWHWMRLLLFVSGVLLVVSLFAHQSGLTNLSALMFGVFGVLLLVHGALRSYVAGKNIGPDLLRTASAVPAVAVLVGLVASVPRIFGGSPRSIGLDSPFSWVVLSAGAAAALTLWAVIWTTRRVSAVEAPPVEQGTGNGTKARSRPAGDALRMWRLGWAADRPRVCEIVGGPDCPSRRQMRRAVHADFVLLGAYGSLASLTGAALIMSGNRVWGGLVAVFGLVAAVLDFVENRMLLRLLAYLPPRPDEEQAPGPLSTRWVAVAKLGMLGAALAATLAVTGGWVGR